VLRILSEDEWRAIGITQSMGWEHYEVHGKRFSHELSCRAVTDVGYSLAPEPHVLLFRRDKSLDYPTAVPDTAPVPHAKHPRRQ
jgi:cyclin-dependent kinase regulatory subunit CKS1